MNRFREGMRRIAFVLGIVGAPLGALIARALLGGDKAVAATDGLIVLAAMCWAAYFGFMIPRWLIGRFLWIVSGFFNETTPPGRKGCR